MARRTQGTRGAGPAQDSIICCSIGPNVYEHWLDTLGDAFDIARSIAEDPPDDEWDVTADWLHSRAAEAVANVVCSIEWQSQVTPTYERDTYYVGESEEEALKMRAILNTEYVDEPNCCPGPAAGCLCLSCDRATPLVFLE